MRSLKYWAEVGVSVVESRNDRPAFEVYKPGRRSCPSFNVRIRADRAEVAHGMNHILVLIRFGNLIALLVRGLLGALPVVPDSVRRILEVAADLAPTTFFGSKANCAVARFLHQLVLLIPL